MNPQNNHQPGFRLQYLEVLNWGTFDRVIWRINPDSQTTLLTGANGSGKTTLVDALLTLFVPTSKRYYNQSSGADQKKDRDERSYMLGYYSKTLEEGKNISSALKLRDTDTHSILLACFHNPASDQYVTLAQIRSFSGSEIKRAFVVAQQAFTISEHFQSLDSRGEWRKRLKQYPKTNVFDQFRQYSQEMIHCFGLRSEKALWLFGKTVGVKDIGQLNDFIRINMLEEHDTESDFNALREHYDTLLSTYTSIRKARKQLEMLIPVVAQSDQFDLAEKEGRELKEIRELLPAFYAQHEIGMLEQARSDVRAELRNREDRRSEVLLDLSNLRQQEGELQLAIKQDKAGRRLEQIGDHILQHRKDLDRRKELAEEYASLAKRFGLKEEPDERQFMDQAAKAELLQRETKQKEKETDDRLLDLRMNNQRTNDSILALTAALKSYRSRKSQIPPDNIEVRARIAEALGVPEHELPFAGELIRVREEESEWEPAIEKLLHEFGLHILVPDELYSRVSRYVNENRMGRLVTYFKIDPDRRQVTFNHDDRNVFHKIEIKPDHPFESWIERQFNERFDYLCCDMDEFQRSSKALTSEGQIRDRNRHRKDDRPDRMSRSRFILGWDNKEKILAIERECRQLEKELNETAGLIAHGEKEIARLREDQQFLRDFLKMKTFSSIDWRSVQKSVDLLERERAELLHTSDQLARLKEQMSQIQSAISDKEDRRSKLEQEIGKLGGDEVQYGKQITEAKSLLESYSHVIPDGQPIEECFPRLKRYLTIDEMPEEMDAFRRWKKERGTAVENLIRQKDEQLKHVGGQLTRSMSAFIQGPRDARFADWAGDVLNLQPLPEQRSEYKSLHDLILSEQLPVQQERFRKYMNETAIEKITEFKTTLENRAEEIIEHMEELNESLKRIDFEINPPSYIQLRCTSSRDVAIVQFRAELRSALPDTGRRIMDTSDELLEEEFFRVKHLIDGLAEDENRRRKVLDVRNWLEFSARETYSETGEPGRYYDSSGSTSGGERAQFTYTILAAAIAYQFGINKSDPQGKALRFIAVDEAFSKLDPEKSLYLMKLCERLDLQLLVVTPLDKIHVVEPFISACHYVENKERRTSAVYNLTMEEYHARKSELEMHPGNELHV